MAFITKTDLDLALARLRKWALETFSGGGGGGTSNYNDLTNKPSINNVTLSGNKASSDLGLADSTTVSNHIANTSNPHSVTKSQIGLGNVDNTSDMNKPVSTATQNALDLKADTSALGDLAYKDSASTTYTPAGTISGTSVTYADTPNNLVDISYISANGTLPTFSQGTDTFNAGTLPTYSKGAFSQGTLPTLATSVTGATLTITFSQGTLPTHAPDSFSAGTLPTFTQGNDTFTQGALPTTSTLQRVWNGGKITLNVTNPTFTGTQATIEVD